MYVSKFLALNLELDPPDYSNLADNPEDVSSFNSNRSNRIGIRSKLRNSWASKLQTLRCLTI